MKACAWLLVGLAGALSSVSCTPDWATDNNTPYILEIASINGGSPLKSDVLTNGSIVNDDVLVTVNLFRKNNNPQQAVGPVEHVYLERYEINYRRSDGHNVQGVDVPYSISGPLGNVRFHTASSNGEIENTISITVVRHQAKAEPPLRNMEGGGNQNIITTIAEFTIHGRTVQGGVMEARGSLQVTFADFADAP
jgi:hypothetical protein